MLLAGCLGSAAGCALLMPHPSLPLFLVAMAVFGAGSGLLDVAPGAMLGDVVGGRGGTVVASYQMAGDLGSLSGPLVAGALADTAGFSAAFGVTAGVLVVAAGVGLRAPETLIQATGTATILSRPGAFESPAPTVRPATLGTTTAKGTLGAR